MILRTISIALIVLIMNGCKEPVKSKSDRLKTETVKVDSLGEKKSNEIIIQDTVSHVLHKFTSRINPEWIDDPYDHPKRIDKIHVSSIKETGTNDPNTKELIINHKDSENYVLAKITVPKNFNIELLSDGWVCSIRNKEGKINGPLSIYYSNFTEMYETTYDNDKAIETNNVYDSKGEIIFTGELSPNERINKIHTTTTKK